MRSRGLSWGSMLLACLAALAGPPPAVARYVLEIRNPHPKLDPAMRALAQACASDLDAAAATAPSYYGEINRDISNVAVDMLGGRRSGLASEVQDLRRYIAVGVPPAERTRALAKICIRQAALNGMQDAAAGGGQGGAASPGQPAGAAPSPSPSPSPTTASVDVRNVGVYGTACVRASIRNVRRPPAEPRPHPTSWVGDWTLSNSCPIPQWVRIEVRGGATIFWHNGLHHPGARMQPSPRQEPQLWFTPLREHDFQLHWLVPAGGNLVDTHPVPVPLIQQGLDVYVASCDAIGPQERQAIYLSAPLTSRPEVACYNHGLPDGGRSLASLDRVVQRNPQAASGYVQRGFFHYQQRDYARAIGDFSEAIRIEPRNMTAYHLRAIAHNVSGDQPRAIADYDEVIRSIPPSWGAFRNRGLAHAAQGNHARALADFDEAIRLNPRNPPSFTSRGALYLGMRDPARAVADYDQSILLDPGNAQYRINRAKALSQANDPLRALADIREALRLEPDNAHVQNNACWFLATTGVELDLARAACDAAIRISPGTAYFLDSRGLVSLKQGRFQEAWNDYDAAIRVLPGRAHHLYGRGIAALRLGRVEEGTADIDAATKADPAMAETYRGFGVTP